MIEWFGYRLCCEIGLYCLYDIQVVEICCEYIYYTRKEFDRILVGIRSSFSGILFLQMKLIFYNQVKFYVSAIFFLFLVFQDVYYQVVRQGRQEYLNCFFFFFVWSFFVVLCVCVLEMQVFRWIVLYRQGLFCIYLIDVKYYDVVFRELCFQVICLCDL